jgi:putative chitinase
MLTESTLQQIMPGVPSGQLALYTLALNQAMSEAGITTITRASAFLGQLAHESAELRYMEEIADGSAYEGRKDLGNTTPGDGRRYKGRGPIQITGRANYRAASVALGVDFERNPKLAAEPANGFRIAAWYWTSRKLNDKADALDFMGITKAINGGVNGYSARFGYYHKALEVLGKKALL